MRPAAWPARPAPRRDDRAAHAQLPTPGNDDDATHRPPPLPAERTPEQPPPPLPDSSHIVRRTGTTSRPSGRSAVGLRPSPDPEPLPRRAHQPGRGKENGPVSTLDRPRSFRDDLLVAFVAGAGVEPATSGLLGRIR